MTMRELVAELTAQGHTITYRNRSDGGILITSIDGKRYTGARGNAEARRMSGASLSQARKTQLKIIKPKKGKKPATPLPKTLTEMIKKVQEVYNVKKIPLKQGRITKRLIRKIYEQEGLQSAYNKLERALKYASGVATSRTIDALISSLESYAKLVDADTQKMFQDLIADILINEHKIQDEWIKPAYETLYTINQGANPKDVINDVRRILRL